MKTDLLFPDRGMTLPRMLATLNDTFIVIWLARGGHLAALSVSEFETYTEALIFAKQIVIDEYQYHFNALPPTDYNPDIHVFDLK